MAVAAAESTKVVPFVMEATVAPVGMPTPVTTEPTARPAVLVTVTVVLALVVLLPVATVVPALVEIPVRLMPLTGVVAATAWRLVRAAAAVRPDPEPVAAWLSTRLLPLIELITVPSGMLVPAIAMPAVNPAALLTVTLLVPLVVMPVRFTAVLAKVGSNTKLLLMTGAAPPAPLMSTAPSLKLLKLPSRKVPPEMFWLVCKELMTLLPLSVWGEVMFATPAGLSPDRLVKALVGAPAMTP